VPADLASQFLPSSAGGSSSSAGPARCTLNWPRNWAAGCLSVARSRSYASAAWPCRRGTAALLGPEPWCWRWRLGGARWAAAQEVIANDNIPFNKVRVVDASGLLGDFMLGEALALARQRRTDLVVIAAEVDPPLCRLIAVTEYQEELDRKTQDKEGQRHEKLLREFSFDPAMKVKGMRFTAMVDEHDLERKVNQLRAFLEKGHRVEARILQGRCPPEDVLDLALRIIAELRDLAKPEYFEESLREFQAAVMAPKSLKRAGKANADEMRLRLWPCTPEQAAAFQLPAQVLGPRRRRGPRIAGIDDGEQPEDAWKFNRKPHTRDKGFTKRDLRKAAY